MKNRGASQILVFFNEATPGSVTLADANEVLSIQSTKFDYAAAEMVEKYHVITRESTAPGVLSIICHEPLSPMTNTVVNIKTIELPVGTNCAHECGQGTCEGAVCKCTDGFFGKACSKEIKLMDKEITNYQQNVAPYETFTIIADLTDKDKEVKITLESEAKPVSSLLIAEAESKVPNKFMFRDKQSKSSLVFVLENLTGSGKQTKAVIAEKNWIYFTFQSHENRPITV